jgi:hypothetical protein
MKRWFIAFILANVAYILCAQQTDVYFGGDVGINFGIQELNKAYESALSKIYGSNYTIEKPPSFTFSLYTGYYGFTDNIAIQTGVDFNINEKINQAIKNYNAYSNLSYSYINIPLQLRISRKIFSPINIGLLFGPYLSFPLGEIEEKSLIETQKYKQEVTYGITLDQFITYSIKSDHIIILTIKYRRDFSEKFVLSNEGINFGIFTQQNIKITIGYEYHLNI